MANTMLELLEQKDQNGFTRPEIIYPERARDLLQRNSRNRKLSLVVVAEYKAALIAGRWKLNGETIKIAADGSLLDGQHRLAACFQSGVPLRTYVAYGIEDTARPTIDTGKKRTAGDNLQMLGADNCNQIAAAIRWIDAITPAGINNNSNVPNDDVVARWHEIGPAVAVSLASARKCFYLLGSGLAVALHFKFAEVDRSSADAFFDALANGVGLQTDDPIYHLRERLVRSRVQKSTLRKEERIAICIRAWNAFRRGEKMKTLRGIIKTGESSHFPQIF